jgi:uncharacterized protein (TIGR03790 family)
MALLWCALAAAPLLAGGGPENVLLVVNANSDSSKTIANHYIELRKIPPSNVVYIDWKGSLEDGSALNLRDKILHPVIKALDDRHLTPQIDYIVYSSDFPWRVNLQYAFPKHEFKAPFDPMASITGATYLMPLLLGNRPELVQPGINWYLSGPIGKNEAQCTELANVKSRGFRTRYLWDPEGNKTEEAAKGQRYLLSTMLGVTQGRGNTVDEVITYLRRAAGADGTRPQGTVYFMWNGDVRSSTRDKCFPAVAAQINAAGVRAKVQQGIIPDGAKDVCGLMVGAAKFDVKKSNMLIRPGSICEHLTSAGGILFANDFQTPLSDFLRYGAAGASGTVAEPRAIQAKFPLPSLQLHYVRGCSLAEAFYQSLSTPYQILIVGDPLCQPWATAPKVSVQGIKANEVVKGKIAMTPTGTAKGGRPLGAMELFVDGVLTARNTTGGLLEIDTTRLADGYHELRFVGIDSDPVETQGRLIVPITVQNGTGAVEFSATPQRAKSLDKIRVKVRFPGAKSVTIRQNFRDLASVQGEAGEVEIPALQLGRGPATLQAFSEGDTKAVSAPVRVLVE